MPSGKLLRAGTKRGGVWLSCEDQRSELQAGGCKRKRAGVRHHPASHLRSLAVAGRELLVCACVDVVGHKGQGCFSTVCQYVTLFDITFYFLIDAKDQVLSMKGLAS